MVLKGCSHSGVLFVTVYAVAGVQWRSKILTGHAVAGVQLRAVYYTLSYAVAGVQWRAVYNRLCCCDCHLPPPLLGGSKTSLLLF